MCYQMHVYIFALGRVRPRMLYMDDILGHNFGTRRSTMIQLIQKRTEL